MLGLIICLSVVNARVQFQTFEKILKKQNLLPPTSSLNRSLQVKLGFYLESVGNFKSTDMTFDVDLYIYMSWLDRRLKHPGPDLLMINEDNRRKSIWLPDLYFANARHATSQKVMQPNFNLFISPKGQVAYSARCTLTVACSLNLRYYPMDRQICSIRTLSYAYIAKQVTVTWFEGNPMAANPEIALPEFYITKVENSYCNGSYQYALMPNSHKHDEFSCLSGNIYLSRSIGYNLLQSYIPTSLIVTISWVSFWIDRRAVPARITLSFTTLVSFTTLGSGMRIGLAHVSYAKAIDFWYGTCLLFVFMALLEFAIVNGLMRRAEKYEMRSKRLLNDMYLRTQVSSNGLLNKKYVRSLYMSIIAFLNYKKSIQNGNLLTMTEASGEDMMEECYHYRIRTKTQISFHFSHQALKIDQISRFIFPIAFIIFNVLYWSYYLIILREF